MEEKIKNYLEGKSSRTEQLELLEWLRNEQNMKLFRKYSNAWESNPDAGFPRDGLDSWNKIQEHILHNNFKALQKTRRIQLLFRYAAIFLLAITVGSLTYLMSNKNLLKENLTHIIAENGQVSKVELSDGSLVWLNSGSEIAYSSFYGSKNRNIKLTGEGFFQVSKNEEVPFMVQCDEISIKVTGTRFNVEAYPEENCLNVVLEEGAVELLDPERETLLYRMNPGEMVQYNKSDKIFNVSHINTAKFTSWKEGILNIYNQRLEDLVKKLELRYNQKFEVENEVKDFRYTFTVKNETLEEVIDLIQQITPVKVEQENETIIIKLIQRED